MPELPEVETVVRTLRPALVGRTVQAIRCGTHRLRTPWQSSWNKHILGSTIIEINRRGKWILLALSIPDYRLIVHLGMTGRLLIQPKHHPKTDHTHLVFSLDGNEQLRYHDPRRFGSVTLAHSQDQHRFPQEAVLGPEPFDLTTPYFQQCMMKAQRNLKAILLDQSVVAGVGNIYADESLFEARLNPRRLGASLNVKEADLLRKAIVKVLRRAIESKGSTIANFYFGNEESGGFQHEFKAYGRTDEPCYRCKAPIKCIRLAGRSTHYCPGCQR